MGKVSFSDWNYRNGLRFHAARDYRGAAGFFRRAAECGHPEAQFRLGKMHAEGTGVARDIDSALKWLGKAADQGHAGAREGLDALVEGRDRLDGEARADAPEVEVPAPVVSGAGDAEGPVAAPGSRLEEWYREGLREKDAGNPAGAVVLWKKVLAGNIRHVNAANAIACAYARSGRLDMAKKYVDMALKSGGGRAGRLRAGHAGTDHSSERFEEADASPDPIGRGDAGTVCILARVLGAEGKMERAAGLIEDFLSRQRFAAAPRPDGDAAMQEVVARGADCLLGCRPYDAVDFLEKYSRLLPPEPRAKAYFNAGIRFLREEDDGVTALNCLSEAVRNDPDDEEMKEALFDAAWRVVAELEWRGNLFRSEVRALALACETLGGLKPVQQDFPDGRT